MGEEERGGRTEEGGREGMRRREVGGERGEEERGGREGMRREVGGGGKEEREI